MTNDREKSRVIDRDDIDRTIAGLRAAGHYVNARGLTNAAGAADLLCIEIGTLRNWHSKDKAPRSYRPNGDHGPRYYCVRDLLEFIEAHSGEKK